MKQRGSSNSTLVPLSSNAATSALFGPLRLCWLELGHLSWRSLNLGRLSRRRNAMDIPTQ